ncbi:hypothetical protein B0H17DRAFT_379443 [Mycena rosella]|uniref:Uncharacterized protein n=1 Tax=Mycena rosella TaxID=1033263 RepID=A0AAD7CNK9_MYCRO|nr:hypothetical protein B0H17DRAFT_379443 [Mycena rosella]
MAGGVREDSNCDRTRNALTARTPTQSTTQSTTTTPPRPRPRYDGARAVRAGAPPQQHHGRCACRASTNQVELGAGRVPDGCGWCVRSRGRGGGRDCAQEGKEEKCSGPLLLSHTQVATKARVLPASATRNTDTRARRAIFRPRPQLARPGSPRRARLGDSGRAAGAAGVYAVGAGKYRGRWARDAKRGCAGADGRDNGGTAESEGRRPERGEQRVRRAGRPAGARVREDAV